MVTLRLSVSTPSCLETLSHVADQQAPIDSIAHLLRPKGYLVLTTQNRNVMTRLNAPPLDPGRYAIRSPNARCGTCLAGRFAMVRIGAINAPGYGRISRLRVAPTHHLTRLAERAGIGKTLVVVARRA